MDVDNILDSDQRILAHTKRQSDESGTKLVFEFDDGPLTGQLPEKLDASMLTEWCAAVRREYNARKNRKETQTTRPKTVDGGAPDKASPGPGVSRGGGLPVPEDAKGAKEALESNLQSSLLSLGERRSHILVSIEQHEADLAVLRGKLAQVEDAAAFYERMLGGLNDAP